MVTYLLDLSHYQDGINVGKAVREGFSAVICKATEGYSYKDPCFSEFTSAATEAGAVPGAYHFLRSGNGAVQAQRFFNRVEDAGGPDGWLCVCDNEADASWATTKAFFAEWDRLSDGHPLIMYTGAWWWDVSWRGWNGSSLTPYLWHSHYVSGAGYASTLYQLVPESWWSPGYGGWRSATILQFSSKASVAGKTCDVNAFRGTREQLLALTTKTKNEEVTDVEQSDKLIVETGNDGRTVGQHFGDLQRMRGFLIGETGDAADVPPDGSPLARLVAAADRPAATIAMTEDDRIAIAGEVADQLFDSLMEAIDARLTKFELVAEKLGEAGDALGVLNDEAS